MQLVTDSFEEETRSYLFLYSCVWYVNTMYVYTHSFSVFVSLSNLFLVVCVLENVCTTPCRNVASSNYLYAKQIHSYEHKTIGQFTPEVSERGILIVRGLIWCKNAKPDVLLLFFLREISSRRKIRYFLRPWCVFFLLLFFFTFSPNTDNHKRSFTINWFLVSDPHSILICCVNFRSHFIGTGRTGSQ